MQDVEDAVHCGLGFARRCGWHVPEQRARSHGDLLWWVGVLPMQDGYIPPLDWLPWVFEIQPVASTWMQQLVAAGEVWLLPAAHGAVHAAHNTAYRAAVVLSHSPLNSRTCAGVVAVQESAVAAALEFVDSKVPHFVAYIDSGSRHSSGAVDTQLRLPPVLELGRQGLPVDRVYMCYLVYSRPADRRGLPDVAGLNSKL